MINGYGKSAGLVQIEELGQLETPVALTNTLNVGKVSDALVQYTIGELEKTGKKLRSLNPVVGECNDASLNEITDRNAGYDQVAEAIMQASDTFEQGSVGAGTGMTCHDLKGGIGSASRIIKIGRNIFTLGVLLLCNHGNLQDLRVNGKLVGPEIGKRIRAEQKEQKKAGQEESPAGTSADYSEDVSYPMIMFIPDATGSGKSAADIVSQYYGAAVWATDEDQEKHPSFVFVPAFTDTVVDDNWNASDQIDTAVQAINELTETYSIDTDRLYTTGQSMGCMTSLYLNSKYPDMFAASLFVSGQWDISVLSPLTEATFFYVTAGGDQKASGGQTEVMEMLDNAGVSYSYGEWNAQDAEEEQNAAASQLIAEGNSANFIRFETGSVLNGGQGMEHMASFNYAYEIDAVRDWLFEQSR